jgi:hypothetical protein
VNYLWKLYLGILNAYFERYVFVACFESIQENARRSSAEREDWK